MATWNSCAKLLKYIVKNIALDELSCVASSDSNFVDNAEGYIVSYIGRMDNEVGLEMIFDWEENQDCTFVEYLSSKSSTDEYRLLMRECALLVIESS